MTHIPNGSRVNVFLAGGPNGGLRLEVVKPGPTPKPANFASPMPREAAYRELEQARLDLSTDPGHVYAKRAAAGAQLRADTSTKAPKSLQETTIAPAAVYAARRVS